MNTDKRLKSNNKYGIKVFVVCLMSAFLNGCFLTPSEPDTRCVLDEEGYYQNCSNEYYDEESDDELEEENNAQSEGFIYPVSNSQTTSNVQQGSSNTIVHFKLVDDYAEQLAMELISGLNQPVYGGIAITSFVNFDSQLQNSNMLGNQLAESLIHEMQKYNLNIVDFKTMNQIKMTSQGDFVFSRKASDLMEKQNINYVLTGVMIRERTGIALQSRIINLKTKQVITSASKLMPDIVISSLGM